MWSSTLRHTTRHLHVAARSPLIRRLHTSTVCRDSLFAWFTSRKSKPPPPPVSPEDQFLDIFEEEPIDTKSPSYRFAQRMKAKLEKKEEEKERKGEEEKNKSQQEKSSQQQPQQQQQQQQPPNQQQRQFTTHEARIRHAVNEMKQRQQQQHQSTATFSDLDADHFEAQAMTLAKQVLQKLEQEKQAAAESVIRATITTPTATPTATPTPTPSTTTPTPMPTPTTQSAQSNIPPPPPPPPLTPMPTTHARISPTTSTSPSFYAINRAVRAMTGGIRPPDHTTQYTHQSTTSSLAKDEPVNWNSPLAPPSTSTTSTSTETSTTSTSTVTPFDMTEFLDIPVKPATSTSTSTGTSTVTSTPTSTPAPSADSAASTWFDGIPDAPKTESISVSPIPSVDAVLDITPRIAAERLTEAIQTATASRLPLLNYASELVTMAAQGHDPHHLHTSTSSATNMSSRVYSHPHVISCSIWTCQCSTCIGKLELSHDNAHTITCYYSLNEIQQAMDHTSVVIQIRPKQQQKQGMTLVIPWKEFSARYAPALSSFPYPSLRISTNPTSSYDLIPSTSTCTHRCNLTHILHTMSDDTHTMDELPSHVQTLFYTWIQERGIGNKSKDVILSDLISLHATLTSHALSLSSSHPITSESSLTSAWITCLTQYHDTTHALQLLYDFFTYPTRQDVSHTIPTQHDMSDGAIPTLFIPLMNEFPMIQKDEDSTMIPNEDSADEDVDDVADDDIDTRSETQKLLEEDEELDQLLARRYQRDDQDEDGIPILNNMDEIDELIQEEFLMDENEDEIDENYDIDENDEDEDESDESDWSDSESENQSEDENHSEDEYSDSDSE